MCTASKTVFRRRAWQENIYQSRSLLGPVLFLVCSGLVACRLVPDASVGHLLSNSLAGYGASDRLRSFFYTRRMPAHGERCQQWCADRDEPSSHTATLDHCILQCISHPEVMDFLPDLRATAAVPPPVQNCTLLFGAFYAEGDGGSEVRIISKILSNELIYHHSIITLGYLVIAIPIGMGRLPSVCTCRLNSVQGQIWQCFL